MLMRYFLYVIFHVFTVHNIADVGYKHCNMFNANKVICICIELYSLIGDKIIH